MWGFIWLGLVLLLVTALLYLSKYEESFDTVKKDTEKDTEANPPSNFVKDSCGNLVFQGNPDEDPNKYYIDILSDKIYNKPPPPGVDITEKTLYAPVDIMSNLQTIKSRMDVNEQNLPVLIVESVNQQVPPIVGGILRENGFPMTDDTYGMGTVG